MKYLKILIAFISICFLFFIFYSNLQDIKNVNIVSIKVLVVYIVSLSFMYAILLILLALSWKNILESLSKTIIVNKIIWIYLKSMIFKYIPGNVFHYVARQIEAKKEGITHKNLIQSNILEAVIIIIASVIISLFAVTFIKNIDLDSYIHTINMNLVYFISFSLMIILFFVSKYNDLNYKNYIQPLCLYLIFFFGIGFITYLIINKVMLVNLSLLICVFLYSVSWLIGFITPGAPGGLGVRESLFVILSSGIISVGDAFILSAILRLITIIGEVIIFAISIIILKNNCKKEVH